MTLKEYFEKYRSKPYKMSYPKLIKRAKELNPKFKLSNMAMSQYVNGRRPKYLETAYWISRATNGEVSVNELYVPQDEIEKIESKVGNNLEKARAA